MNTQLNIQRGVRRISGPRTTQPNIMRPFVIHLKTAGRPEASGRVLCVGIQREGLAPQLISDDQEATLLRRAWLEFDTRESDEVLVTFAGHRVGFPCLLRRSYMLDVPVRGWIPRDGHYPRQAFTDLVELWQCGNPAATLSLDRMARLCGLATTRSAGARFPHLWRKDRPAALACLNTELTQIHQLWRRMAAP